MCRMKQITPFVPRGETGQNVPPKPSQSRNRSRSLAKEERESWEYNLLSAATLQDWWRKSANSQGNVEVIEIKMDAKELVARSISG